MTLSSIQRCSVQRRIRGSGGGPAAGLIAWENWAGIPPRASAASAAPAVAAVAAVAMVADFRKSRRSMASSSWHFVRSECGLVDSAGRVDEPAFALKRLAGEAFRHPIGRKDARRWAGIGGRHAADRMPRAGVDDQIPRPLHFLEHALDILDRAKLV